MIRARFLEHAHRELCFPQLKRLTEEANCSAVSGIISWAVIHDCIRKGELSISTPLFILVSLELCLRLLDLWFLSKYVHNTHEIIAKKTPLP